MKSSFQGLLVTGLLALGMSGAMANPQGGQVAAGSASINTVPGTVTVNQLSNTAIINWQTFSISSGELTQFIQPSASSAVLNRVLTGQTVINGTLSANGQVYLVNGNGIVVGPGGVVNAAGFTASTRDIADSDFLSGNLHFTGSGAAGVQNLGTINAIGGDVVLIGKTVDNQGTITAPNGTTGLIAGDDVLLAQKNSDGSTIMVSPTTTATSASNQVGVHNSGTITAANAELKAANGNIYALAVQNEGTIRATTVQHQGGHIWLTSDSGTVVNSGTLDASATAAKGKGGTITLKSTNGTAIQSGKIIARGGQGGAGGSADVSGQMIQFTGTVDLTASSGTTGTLLIDPATLDVITGGTDTITGGQNTGTSSTIDPSVVDAALENASLILNADNGITISNALTWDNGSTLTLSTNNPGSTLNINAPITTPFGGLVINLAAATDLISTSSAGAVAVNFFTLQSGFWNQNSALLPAFSGGNDFEIQGASTFVRVTGGDGSGGTTPNPLQITDVWGLQGLASITANLAADVAAGEPIAGENATLENNINAFLSGSWNGETGFAPIGTGAVPYGGTFNGNNYFISNLTINGSVGSVSNVGLFGVSSGTIENVGVINPTISGNASVGGLVGDNASTGIIKNSYVSGGINASIAGNASIGGLVGENDGLVETSYSTVPIQSGEGMDIGGLVGLNKGTMQTSYSTSSINAGMQPGGVDVGGLVGENDNLIQTCYSTGVVNGDSVVGGLVGFNTGLALNSYWNSDANPTLASVDSSSTGTLTNVNGESMANLMTQTTFQPTGTTGAPNWDFTNDWIMIDGQTTPLLRSLSSTISGTTFSDNGMTPVTVGDSITLYSNGLSVGSATSSGAGAYSFLIPADEAVGGVLLVDKSEASNTFYSSSPTLGAATGVDLWANTLRIVGTGMATNTMLAAAAQGVDTSNGIVYTANLDDSSFGFDVDVPTGNVEVEGAFSLDGNISVDAGSFTTTATAPLTLLNLTFGQPLGITTTNSATASGDITLGGSVTAFGLLSLATNSTTTTTTSNINLQAAITAPAGGGLMLNSAGTISDTAAVNVDSFFLEGGAWQQLVEDGSNTGTGNIIGNLPSFTVGTNFELDGGTFLRAAGGNGTSAPYLITDIYGLQGLGSPSENLFSANAQLANDIDASMTGTWNTGSGFHPIGDSDLAYGGTFDGESFAINGLTMNQEDSPTNIGLFGVSSGTIQNVALTNINISAGPFGGSFMGGLVGDNRGTVANCVASGTVTVGSDGIEDGGLVGQNNGLVTLSSSTVVVSGSTDVGGLVGLNSNTESIAFPMGGIISNSSSTGPVIGNGTQPSESMGGLVGENDGTVQTSSSTGTVTGNAGAGSSQIGGLVGDNTGLVQTSFSAGAVTGGTQVGGLVGENSGTVMDSYAITMVTGLDGGDSIGGLVGENDNLVETSYSAGPVNGGVGSTNVGGLVGNNTSTVTNSFWATDTSGQTNSAGGVGATAAQLADYNFFFTEEVIDTNPVPTPGLWDFALGTGNWGVGVVGPGGQLNGGLPVLQVFVPPIVAQVQAVNQTIVYGQAPDLTDAFNILQGSAAALDAAVPGGPTMSIVGGNTDVGTSNIIQITGTPTTPVAVEYANGTETFSPAPLTVVGAAVNNKVYDTTIGATLSSIGTLNGVVTGDTVTIDTSEILADFATKDVGNNIAVNVLGYGLAGASAGNYTLTQPTGLTANITPATLTITGATVAATKVYDATTTDALLTVGTLSGVLIGDTVTLDTTAATANFATKNVGNNLAVTGSGYAIGGADAGDYTLTQPGGFTANITAAPLTITGTTVAATKIYDATTTDAFTAFGTLSGVIPGDTVMLNTMTAAANFATKDVGNNLAVTVSGFAAGGADAGNYTLTQPSGFTANITPATLTITGATVAATKVYDTTTTDTLTALGTLSGIIPGDTVTLNTTAAAANFATKDVGNNLAVTVNGYATGGADAGNYTLTQPGGFTADITPATLTITGATVAGTKVYDTTTTDALTAFGTLSGILPGDTVTLNTGAAAANFPSKNVGNNLAVTVTGYAAGGADGGNYTVTQPSGFTADITPATLTVTGTTVAATKVYDATTIDAITTPGTLNGILPGDTVTLNTAAAAANFPSKDVGNNLAVTVTGLSAGGADGGNYTVTQPSGFTADITPAPLTITGATVAGTKVYDTTATDTITTLGTLIGVLPGDTVTLDTTAAAANFPSKNVGNNLAVSVTGYATGGADAGDYTLTQPSGFTADITPATLTITGAAVAGTKVYDATTTDSITTLGTLSGVLPGDTVTLDTTAASANFPSKNVGNNLAVTVTGYAAGGADGGNYTVTQPSGFTADITAAPLTVTGAVAGNKTYDGTTVATLSNFGALNGVIPGDTVTINSAASSANFSTPNAGNNLAVTVAGYALGGADGGNYTVTSPTGLTANITQAPLTITANGFTKVFDGTAFNGGNGVTYSTFVNGETPAVLGGALTYGGSAQGAIAIGNYLITPGGLTSSNYAITFNSGNLNITSAIVPPPITVIPLTPLQVNLIASVIASGVNLPIPTGVGLGLLPPSLGVALVVADGQGSGAVNNGGQDPAAYIAFASGVTDSGAPTLGRLLTGGDGTSVIANGIVTWVQPPAIVLSEFERIFSASIQDQLQQAAFNAAFAGASSQNPPYILLLTPGGGTMVIANGDVNPGQPPDLVLQEFNTIFGAALQNQLQNAVVGSQ